MLLDIIEYLKNMTNEEATKKNLLKFKRDFIKLLGKYPEVSVYGNINGDLQAYQTSSPWKAQMEVNLPSYFSVKS